MTNNSKKVKLKFNSKIIDHLGTDKYQQPVAAIDRKSGVYGKRGSVRC